MFRDFKGTQLASDVKPSALLIIKIRNINTISEC